MWSPGGILLRYRSRTIMETFSLVLQIHSTDECNLLPRQHIKMLLIHVSLFIMMFPTFIHPTQTCKTTTPQGKGTTTNHTIAKQSVGLAQARPNKPLSNTYTQLQFTVTF